MNTSTKQARFVVQSWLKLSVASNPEAHETIKKFHELAKGWMASSDGPDYCSSCWPKYLEKIDDPKVREMVKDDSRPTGDLIEVRMCSDSFYADCDMCKKTISVKYPEGFSEKDMKEQVDKSYRFKRIEDENKERLEEQKKDPVISGIINKIKGLGAGIVSCELKKVGGDIDLDVVTKNHYLIKIYLSQKDSSQVYRMSLHRPSVGTLERKEVSLGPQSRYFRDGTQDATTSEKVLKVIEYIIKR